MHKNLAADADFACGEDRDRWTERCGEDRERWTERCGEDRDRKRKHWTYFFKF